MRGRRYDTPPKNLSSLEQRLRNIAGNDQLQLRTRRQVGYMAVIAALRAHARDGEGQPLFAIKGGVAIELLLGLEARATKDLDASVRTTAEEIEPRLRDALAQGWDGFTFRLVSWEPVRDTAAHRGDIKLAYKGRPFSTVQFEAAAAEGKAGQALHFIDNTFVDPGDLGLMSVGEVPLVTLAYLMAQKLHACTDHSNAGWANDRARDLIDILGVHRLLEDTELVKVRQACVEIFRLRAKHKWPPSIAVLPEWPELYQAELAKTPGFAPSDVRQAARDVDALIAQIDAATSTDEPAAAAAGQA
jgi:Nucleotidyl transferase AbiEii toxin, Type IV TA system